jgi:hypothetical protein
MLTKEILIEKIRIAIADPNLNEKSNNKNTENWDSLGQLSVLATLSKLTNGISDSIEGIEDVSSFEEIYQVLKSKLLIE